jgi:hypothetical protein
MKIIDKNSPLKEIIIDIIASSDNLSLIKIHNIVKKTGKNVTYQASYKIIQQLILENTVTKNKNNTYSINYNWIKNKKNYYENLIQKKEKKYLSDEIVVYDCKNLLETDILWCEYLLKGITESDEKVTVWEGPHAWWINGNLENENILLDKLREFNVKSYLKITSSNYFSKFSEKFYLEKNTQCKVIINEKNKDTYLGVSGPYLLKLKLPQELSEKINSYYDVNKYEEFQLTQFIELMNTTEYNLKLEVIRNEFLANYIKEKIILDIENLN